MVLAGVIALLLAGCGSGASRSGTSAGSSAAQSPQAAREAADIKVIRAWATALRQGNLPAAAAYFARPSLFSNGVVLVIHSRRDAEEANASLSCGAALISAHRQGRYINATFRLTDRPGPGGGCGSGTGETGSTDFLIRHGLIVEWIRAPDNPAAGSTGPGSGSSGVPGNSGVPTTPTPTQTNPGQQV